MTGRGRRARGQHGQSTVELVLALPLVLLMVLMVVQVGLVVRDEVLVVHAAREAVRAAAVGQADPQVRQVAVQAGPLSADRLDVSVTRSAVDEAGDPVVRVHLSYRAPTDLPLVGELVPDPSLSADAVMVEER